ncbi:sigma 54-interacting transcriptional regulator [Salmonella enterica subsp. enterica]|nr:sigma 54-interacting transcriptional regulator [Salmonella enterica subsp. enterica]
MRAARAGGDLTELDLFGHERGAFAAPARSGLTVSSWRIKLAVLDEVGDMPLELQPSFAACPSEPGFGNVRRRKLIEPTCDPIAAITAI